MLDAGVGLLDGGHRTSDGGRVVEQLALLLQPGADESHDALDVVGGASRGALLRRGHDLVAEMRDQLGEPARLVERAILAGQRDRPEVARHGHDRDAHPCPLEVTAVQVDDPLPLGVQVDLRLGEHHRRAQLDSASQEVDLRGRELRRGVRHEDQTVGEREEGECGGGMAGAEPTHAGRVDENESLGENGAGRRDLDPLDSLVVAGVAALGDPVVQRVDRNRAALVAVAAVATDDSAGLLAVAHECDGGGRQIVVHRAHGLTEESVDERALPLLELADHGDDRRGTLEAGSSRSNPADEVRTLELAK